MSGVSSQSPSVAEEEAELIGAVYDAALSGAWPQTLRLVAESIGAGSAGMFSTHAGGHPHAIFQAHNIDPQMGAEFLSTWAAQDEWALGARRKGLMAPGSVAVSQQLVSQPSFLKTAFYNEFARKYDIATIVGSVLFGGNDADGMPFTNLCWYRPDGMPNFERAEHSKVKRLVPHFQRALRIERQVRSIDRTDGFSMLETFGLASITLDARLRVFNCNEQAYRLLGLSAPGGYRHEQLRHIGARCSPSIPEAAALCARGVPVDIMVQLTKPHQALVNARMIHLRPSSDSAQPLGTFNAPMYALLVDMPAPEGAVLAGRAAGLFELSPAEERVLGHLLDGTTAADIAAMTDTGLPTVRTHIQNILAKTGMSRQVDLIRALCGLRY